MIARHRDTGRMDLREAGIAEISAFFMGLPGCRYITAHGIRGQVEYITISAAAEQDGMAEMSFQLTGDQVAGNDAPGLPIDKDGIQHLVTGVHFYIAQGHLSFQGLVGADQQLLPRLPCRIEGPLYLYAAEGAVAQHAPVFT